MLKTGGAFRIKRWSKMIKREKFVFAAAVAAATAKDYNPQDVFISSTWNEEPNRLMKLDWNLEAQNDLFEEKERKGNREVRVPLPSPSS